MKKLFGILLCLAMTAACVCALAGAAIDETNFPDENFREYVKKFDLDGNGTLQDEELKQATEINVLSSGISDLKGIEHFSALKKLLCGDNHLTRLDLSGNMALTELWCDGNQLTSLDLSRNTALDTLFCQDNQLTVLNVDKCSALLSLSCNCNRLTSLNMSNSPALYYLDCSSNRLKSLDVSKNWKLVELVCYHNQLKKLDVSNNISLRFFYCDYNQLTSLDVSKNGELGEFVCDHNQLTSLDLSRNTAVFRIVCDHNQLKSLDVGENTGLEWIICNANQLTQLDVSSIPNLDSLATETEPGERDGYKYWEKNPRGEYAEYVLRVDPSVKVITSASSKINIGKAKISAIKDQYYTGKAIKPVVTVKYKGKKLVPWADYTVSYKDNKKIGTATVVVTGKGKYTGTAKVKFKIIPRPSPASVTVYGSDHVAKGKSVQLQAVVSPEGCSQKVVWSSEDPDIAEADPDTGVLKGKKEGTAIIRVVSKTDQKVQTRIKVYVMEKAVSDITITGLAKVYKKGDIISPSVFISPKGASKIIAWESSDESVVAIDKSSDRFIAMGDGTAVLTAKATDGSKKSASVKIVVNAKLAKELQRVDTEFEENKASFSQRERKVINLVNDYYTNAEKQNKTTLKSTLKALLTIIPKSGILSKANKFPEEAKNELINQMVVVSLKQIQKSSTFFDDCDVDGKMVRKMAQQMVDSDNDTFQYKKITYIIEDTKIDPQVGAAIKFGTITEMNSGRKWMFMFTIVDDNSMHKAMQALKILAESKINEAWKEVLSGAGNILQVDEVLKFLKEASEDKALGLLSETFDQKITKKVKKAIDVAEKYKTAYDAFKKVSKIDLGSSTPEKVLDKIQKYNLKVEAFNTAMIELVELIEK